MGFEISIPLDYIVIVAHSISNSDSCSAFISLEKEPSSRPYERVTDFCTVHCTHVVLATRGTREHDSGSQTLTRRFFPKWKEVRRVTVLFLFD